MLVFLIGKALTRWIVLELLSLTPNIPVNTMGWLTGQQKAGAVTTVQHSAQSTVFLKHLRSAAFFLFWF